MAMARPGLSALREQANGRLLTPDQVSYESGRQTFNAMAAGRPLAILQPEETADIVAAVRWAEAADVAIGVRGGGHVRPALRVGAANDPLEHEAESN